MEDKRALLLKIEFFWWLITAIFAAAVVLPILLRLPDFPYLWHNILFAVCFVVFTRHIFFLRYTFLGPQQYLKIALFFIAIPVVFLLIDQVNFFQNYINDGGLIKDIGSLPYKQQEGIEKYIRTEILLLGTAAIVSGILFGIRMLVSVFRYRNSKTV